MMEQDVKEGPVEVKASESLQAEHVEADVSFDKQLLPFLKVKVEAKLSADIDNAAVVAALASKLPGGWAHDIVVAAAKELGVAMPAAEAAPAAAPSA